MQVKQRVRLGIMGTTGVGKDTFVKILQDERPDLKVKSIRLADPLYNVQHYIYKLCGIEKEFYSQDGILLNFLGQHMRLINPYVLKEYFLQQLNEIGDSFDLLICSDIRPLDVSFVKEQGFSLIHIHTDAQIALERRKRRGDLSLGAVSHKTELGISSSMYDYQIINNGSIDDFKNDILSLVEQLL